MVKDILYYPTIEFQSKDYYWLWAVALLWEKVYRIVPEGYILDEPRNINELCSTEEIGIPLSPNIYRRDASYRFMKNIDEGVLQSDAIQFTNDKSENYCRLYKDKVDVTLRDLMLHDYRVIEAGDWLYVPKEISDHYMTFLATEIALKNSLCLNTHDPDDWTASTYFLHFQGFERNNCYVQESKAALASIFFNEVFPANLLDIPASKILEFREKRKDERALFQTAVDNFNTRVSSASDPKILEQILNDEKLKVGYALNEYKKSMDIMKVVEWGGYLTSLVTLATNVLGYTSIDSDVIQGLTTAGIGVGLLTGLLENKIKPRQTPYSYLSSINRLSADCFNGCNYILRQKLEGLIYD